MDNNNKGEIPKNPFLEYFHKRIGKNKNCIIAIVGETGSGKSYTALKLAETLDPTFDINRVAFTAREFLSLLKKSKEEMPRGSAIVFDESGIAFQSRNFMSVLNKNLSYALQICRFKNHIIIFTVPDMSFVDVQARRLIHMWMVTEKVLFRRKRCRLRPYIISIDHRTGFQYDITPRMVRDERIVKMHKITVGLPSVKLRHAYERKKERYSTSIFEQADSEIARDEVQQVEDMLTEKQRMVKLLDEADVDANHIAKVLKVTKRRVYAIRSEYKNKMNSV